MGKYMCDDCDLQRKCAFYEDGYYIKDCKDFKPMTNEVWLKETENTEQFASKICETFEISCDECKFFDVSSRTGCTFPSWLKAVHK